MNPSRPPLRAFTLIELLVGASLGAVAMTALLAGFVFLARNFSRLANAQMLENQARTALARLQADVAQARAVKNGTVPTASGVTLVLPAGEVTYTYDGTAANLRREATFGPSPDFRLLTGSNCRCTAFVFSYYTGTNGSPASQLSATTSVPYSIKQLQVGFVLQTRADEPAQTAMTQEVVSPCLNLRNKGAPDGT